MIADVLGPYDQLVELGGQGIGLLEGDAGPEIERQAGVDEDVEILADGREVDEGSVIAPDEGIEPELIYIIRGCDHTEIWLRGGVIPDPNNVLYSA